MNYEVKNLRNLLSRARQAGGPWSDDFLAEMANALGEPNIEAEDSDDNIESDNSNQELKTSNCSWCDDKHQCCGCPMGRWPTVEQSEWCRLNDCPKC